MLSALVSSTAEESSLLLDLSLLLFVFCRPHSNAMQSALNLLPAMQYRKKFMALKKRCYESIVVQLTLKRITIYNQKVLLRERKRHTDRSVASTLYPVPCEG